MRLTLTRRADYAVRAVLALARLPDGERLSVRVIAADQHIPQAFLPQVMGDLVRQGIVDGTTGRTGGYRLAKAADDVTLLAVVEAVEGDMRNRRCILRGGPCQVNGSCAVHPVFAAAQDGVRSTLASARLSELIG